MAVTMGCLPVTAFMFYEPTALIFTLVIVQNYAHFDELGALQKWHFFVSLLSTAPWTWKPRSKILISSWCLPFVRDCRWRRHPKGLYIVSLMNLCRWSLTSRKIKPLSKHGLQNYTLLSFWCVTPVFSCNPAHLLPSHLPLHYEDMALNGSLYIHEFWCERKICNMDFRISHTY